MKAFLAPWRLLAMRPMAFSPAPHAHDASSVGDASSLGAPATAERTLTRDTTTPAAFVASARRALATVEGQRRLAWALVIACVTIDVLVVGQHVLLRHVNYHSDAFDLGNMDQAVWNTLHGHFFRFTNRGTDWFGPPTRLAIHVEPILLIIAPFYLIHPGATTLLAIQTVALAAGAIPVLMLALRRLPSLPLVGVAFVVAYLCTPELLGEALWDFHPVTLATPLLLAAFYFFDARRYGWMILMGMLAAACKEDVALAMIPLGVLVALVRGRPRLGIGLVAGAITWTALCFFVIMPHFNAGASVGGNAYWYRYSQLGSSPASALRHVLTNPLLLVSIIFSGNKLGYLALLLRTAGGMGIFAPVWWIAGLPELAINLLSTQSPQYSGFYHYNAIVLAVATVASIYGADGLYRARVHVQLGKPLPEVPMGVGRLGRAREAAARVARWWERQLRRVPISPRWFGVIVATWLLLATGWNLWATAYKIGGFWSAGSTLDPQAPRIAALLDRIPSTAIVAATDTLNPHLSDRDTIYLLPDPLAYQAQYVAVDLVDIPPAMRAEDTQMFEAMLVSGRYHVVGIAGRVTVLRRVGPPLRG